MDLANLREFQTALVGIVGFTGVIAAQFVNSWLARRQKHRDRMLEKRGLQIALLAELLYFERSLVGFLGGSDGSVDVKMAIPELSRGIISDELLKNIGLLDSRGLDVVLWGLLTVEEMNRELTRLCGVAKNSHFDVPREKSQTARLIIGVHIHRIRTAIHLLKSSAPSAKE